MDETRAVALFEVAGLFWAKPGQHTGPLMAFHGGMRLSPGWSTHISFAWIKPRPFSPAAALVLVVGKVRVKPKCLSIFWRCLLHWAAHPRMHIQGCCRAEGLQGLCWGCQITQTTPKSPFLPFSSLFLWLLPLLSKRVPCKQLCSPGLWMVSVGKAETDGSTSSGFAFTMELMDWLLGDAHSVAHQWLTTKENSNQSCTWRGKCLKVTLFCIVSGSIVLKIVSKKPTMPGRAPQPSLCLLCLLSLSNGRFLLWLMGPCLVFLHGSNPSKIKASSHNKWCHPPALAWSSSEQISPLLGHHRTHWELQGQSKGGKPRINTQCCSSQVF